MNDGLRAYEALRDRFSYSIQRLGGMSERTMGAATIQLLSCVVISNWRLRKKGHFIPGKTFMLLFIS